MGPRAEEVPGCGGEREQESLEPSRRNQGVQIPATSFSGKMSAGLEPWKKMPLGVTGLEEARAHGENAVDEDHGEGDAVPRPGMFESCAYRRHRLIISAHECR